MSPLPRRARVGAWLVNGALLLTALMLGGGLYENLVLDPAWPDNIKLVQAAHGGVRRVSFWIPIHSATMLLLVLSLWACWRIPRVRGWLLAATGIYLAMRAWTFLYFIPGVMRFESAEVLTGELASEARTWVFLSALREPMVLAMIAFLGIAARHMLLHSRPPDPARA